MKKLNIILLVLIVILIGTFVYSKSLKEAAKMDKKIEAVDYSYLLGTLDGISDELLQQHFKLYQGYVDGINKMNEKLKECTNCTGNPSFSDYRSIVSSKPFAQNGVVLHEFYFSNLTGEKTTPSDNLKKALEENFGSYDKYIAELKEAAKSARSGWVITGYNVRDEKIYNYIIDLHDEHVPLLVNPLLVFDVWEHAYTVDYGIDKPSYIEAFLKNIDWNIVSERFDAVKQK